MKTIIVLFAALVAVVSLPQETYNPAFENIDVKPLLENPRTLKNYGKCFLDKGPCSPEGLEFKRAIPEAMKSVCAKCSPKQRELARNVIHAFMTKQPEIWNELIQKLDPKGEYAESFNNFLSGTN